MSTHFHVLIHKGTELCSLAACGKPAQTKITATIAIFFAGIKSFRDLSLYLCHDCDLDLRAELNR